LRLFANTRIGKFLERVQGITFTSALSFLFQFADFLACGACDLLLKIIRG
jgi:hypothetical protein